MLNPDAVVWDDWVLLFIQAATLVALVIYVVKTWQIANETRNAAQATAAATEESQKARMAAMAPRIMVYFSPEEIQTAEIVMENVGLGTARNVVPRFEPALQTTFAVEGSTLFAETPKSVIPPKYRISHFIGNWPEYHRKDLPKSYKVRITYEGVETGQKYETEFLLDTQTLHRHALVRKNMHDLVDEVENTRKTLKPELERIGRSLDILVWQQMFQEIPVRSTEHARARLTTTWEMLNRLPDYGISLKWEAARELLRRDALAAAHAAAREGAPQHEREKIDHILSVLLEERIMPNEYWEKRLTEAFALLDHEDDLENPLVT